MSIVATVGESGDNDWAHGAVALLQGKGPTTDEEGRFRVGKLRSGSGMVYFIDPEQEGFGMIASHAFTLAPAEDKDLGEIETSGLPKTPGDKPEPKDPKQAEE